MTNTEKIKYAIRLRQELLEADYRLGLAVRRVVDLPNGMRRVSYVELPRKVYDKTLAVLEKNI